MTTTNILGGGAAQPANDAITHYAALLATRPAGHRDYIEAVNRPEYRNTHITITDVVDPATLALETLDKTTELLQAALALPPDNAAYLLHFRAVIKAALFCLEEGSNAADEQLEQLFTSCVTKGQGHD